MKKSKVQVTERALVARINRALAKQEETLRRCRTDSRSFRHLGAYYTVDLRLNAVTRNGVDIEVLGRKLGVLKEWEALAADK